MHYIQQINAVIEYIENNITSEISFKAIEKISCCSYDSFQRIFSYIIGLSVADYIRSRRLTFAASDLINGNEKIIDISFRYGYNSPDSFTKAFLRFHGLLPSELKKRSSRIKMYPRITLQVPELSRQCKKNSSATYQKYEGGLSMDAFYLEQHLNCNTEEKKEVMDMVNTILYLARIAKESGLLALEKEYKNDNNNYKNPFLKIGISYLADGIETNDLCKILENYLISSHKTGKELLCGIVIIEGLSRIQQGFHPYSIIEPLCSYFGLDFRDEFYKHCEYTCASTTYEDLYKNKEPYSKQTLLLDKYFTMPHRSLQRLLRDIEPETLSIALLGSGFNVLSLFMQNMGINVTRIICSIMQEIHPNEAEIIEAQKSILSTTKELIKQGEIVWDEN